MNEKEAIEWVYEQDESQTHQDDDSWWNDLDEAFRGLYGRLPTQYEYEIGVWSLCCSATPNCGTRP
jgi:hypothetical protein